MSKVLEQLMKERDEAEKQRAIYEHRQERLSQREKYVRSAADRKRTHRLIHMVLPLKRRIREWQIFQKWKYLLLSKNCLKFLQ